jgi:alpha-L-fucosidase 2
VVHNRLPLAPQAHLQEAIDDLRSAIEWIRAHASEYHIHPAKLVLIGVSAGAYLVNYQGTHETAGTKGWKDASMQRWKPEMMAVQEDARHSIRRLRIAGAQLGGRGEEPVGQGRLFRRECVWKFVPRLTPE